jgi:hypothetical protein
MTRHRVIITGAALLAMAGALLAQTKTTTENVKGAAHVTSTRMTGVVDWVQGNTLVARMQPNGHYHVFSVPPGREFIIDGQTRHIGDLKPGTTLTATVTTTTRPVTVPASFKFVVEGKPASVSELKQGMKVSATKIVEEPHTELATNTVVTGKAPK